MSGGGIYSSSHITTQRLWGRGFNPTERPYNIYRRAWLIIPELNDFVVREANLAFAAGRSRKVGELHFETAQMIKPTPLICHR